MVGVKMNKIIDGVKYVTSTEISEDSCAECVGNHNLELCGKIGRDCLDNAFIWKEVKVIKNAPTSSEDEPKYTVDEVIDALQSWDEGYAFSGSIRDKIKQELAVKTSAEYKEFLRLQEKFKDVK